MRISKRYFSDSSKSKGRSQKNKTEDKIDSNNNIDDKERDILSTPLQRDGDKIFFIDKNFLEPTNLEFSDAEVK